MEYLYKILGYEKLAKKLFFQETYVCKIYDIKIGYLGKNVFFFKSHTKNIAYNSEEYSYKQNITEPKPNVYKTFLN
jgi:hypothetical protein